MSKNMKSEFKSYPDRMLFVECILLGWLAIELVETLHRI